MLTIANIAEWSGGDWVAVLGFVGMLIGTMWSRASRVVRATDENTRETKRVSTELATANVTLVDSAKQHHEIKHSMGNLNIIVQGQAAMLTDHAQLLTTISNTVGQQVEMLKAMGETQSQHSQIIERLCESDELRADRREVRRRGTK